MPSRRRYLNIVHKEARKREITLKTWVKRLGVAGFLFFLIKGLLWLIVPALIAYFAFE